MRFLADENMPGAVVVALAGAGHDTAWIRLESPGISDAEVLDRALREGRVLLTFDKDFGQLVKPPVQVAGFGVVLFRIPMPRIADVGQSLSRLILSRTDWAGAFSVIEIERIRMRPLS